MNVRLIQLVTAGVALLLMILCAGLSGSSAGTRVYSCNRQGTNCGWHKMSWRYHVGRWGKATDEGAKPTKSGARWFIFIMEIILAVLALILLVWRLLKPATERKSIIEIAIAGFAALVCLILFGLEVWMATGKALSILKAESWAAAAFFLLVGFLVWAVDAFLSATKRADN